MNATTPMDAVAPVHPRDADSTRQRLLTAARLRFARDGYGRTTVRDIAADAGVNVALINRYFDSKEGLFEACLERVGRDLDAGETRSTLEQMGAEMLAQIAGPPDGERALQLLLLLRSSGDETGDRIRRETLRYYSERMAAGVSGDLDRAPDEALVLRAQVALATGLGILLLRSSAGVEPIASATTDELSGPLSDVLASLLG